MPFVNVKLHTVEKQGTHEHIPNVSVRLFNQWGSALLTMYDSGPTGVVETIVPTELGPFTARMFKIGYAWGPPVALDITEDSEWDLYGEKLKDPVSADPRVCVASGYFRDATNQPHVGIDLHFLPVFDPLLVDGNAVLKERTLVHSDEDGYIEIPLIRGAQYEVTIEGIDECTRRINVPDQFSCNLPDLLFAFVKTVLVAPNPAELAVGAALDLDVTVLASSGVPLDGTATSDVLWTLEQSVTNPVVGMNVLPDKITLTGLVPGAARLIPQRIDQSIISIPYQPLNLQSVPITVIP